jgi:hypothetical protein
MAIVHTHGTQLVVEATQEADVVVHTVLAAVEVRVLVEDRTEAATTAALAATANVAAAVVAMPDSDTGHLVVANRAADVVVIVVATIVTVTASTVVRVLVKSHVAVVHTHGAQLVVETTQEADVVVHIVHATAEVRVLVEAGTKSATTAVVAATVVPDSDTGHLVVANRAADEVVVVIATTIRVTASMVFPVLVKSDAAIVHTHGAQFVVEPAQEPDIPVHTILTAAEVRVLVEDCTETATRGFGFVCIEEVI